jgi:hypothetical protein
MGGKKSNKLLQLLGEPKDEAQMRESVASSLRSKIAVLHVVLVYDWLQGIPRETKEPATMFLYLQ